ncbi:hypothetical protein [Paraburkholderia phenoliruptrix]|uniref:hypothetical protein n=1 Tax=Paraburkholderia phenoliruptrix TaxID=252970 RepID=UPI0039B5830B
MSDLNDKQQKALPPLKAAVAEKAKVSLETVDSIFAQARVVEETGTRRAEHLKIHRLAFSGEKRAAETDNGPFSFEWNDLGSGLWLVLSDNENQIGKSSILGVMLWALRGTQRAVPAPVRSWIGHVELDFSIGLDRYRVAFDDDENVPKGVLLRISPEPLREVAAFSDEAEFVRSMDEFMMRRFALQSIPVVNRKSDEATQIRHDWNAYSGSMFIEGSHPAILGDVAVGGLWWRMLQLFIGLPYSGAQIALSSALALEKLRSEQKQTSATPASFYQDDIQRLNNNIADLEREWTELTATTPRPEEVPELLRRFRQAALEVSKAEQSISDVEHLRSGIVAEVNEARTKLRQLKEGASAKKFFAGLTPVCCPRCAKPFASERLELEQDGGNCAICDRDTLADDYDALAAAIADATSRLEDAKAGEAELDEREEALRATLSTANATLERLETEVGRLDEDADDVRKQQDVRFALERARGAHDQLKALEQQQTAPGPDREAAERIRILRIAESVADERSKFAGAELLRELETKLVEVATRVGFRGLERVSIRGNGIKLTVSGTPTNFSDQTSGQRLRLRVSLVIAMMKLAIGTGQGHHPGLLFIDSPGAEELSETDLNAMMNEIRALCDETSNLQIFVSSARGGTFKDAVPKERQRWPKVVGSMF